MVVSKARRATESRDSGRKRNAEYGPRGGGSPDGFSNGPAGSGRKPTGLEKGKRGRLRSSR